MSERPIRIAHAREINRSRSRFGRRATLGAGGLVGASVLFAPAAEAATFTVTSTADDGADGTLRKEIYDANAAGGPDGIVFQSGLTGTITLTGAGGGDITIDDPLTIQGPGADVISVSGDGLYRIFGATAAETLSITGLTLENADAGNPGNNGGAINLGASDATLTGNVFRNNFIDDDGGAVAWTDADVTIADSVFEDNRGTGAGGALYGGDAGYTLSITNSVFTGNESLDNGGGALYLAGGDAVIRGSTFAGNIAANHAGALYATSADSLTINASTLIDNQAGQMGGAIFAESIELEITDSAITGNTAGEDGGGISLNGAALLRNSTVSGNSADYHGGGIYFGSLYEDQTTRIENSTIVDNLAGVDPTAAGDYGGGGVYLYDAVDSVEDNGPVEISSTVVANNSADFGTDLGQGAFADGFNVGFSLIESSATGAEQINEDPAGSNIIGQDPQLGPLQDNGGPTETHLPGLDSPVLDAGIANGLATDQRGVPRTSDLVLVGNSAGSDGTDIGAVEAQAADVEAQCQGAVVRRLGGGDGDDQITGTDAPEALFGLAGNDNLDGAGGKDCVFGDDGNDTAKGGGGKDQVSGGAGKDKVKGGGGKDRLKGAAGKDNVSGGGGKDTLNGGKGKDKFKAGGGKDTLKAADGKKDKVNCGGGADKATVDEVDKVKANCDLVKEKP